MGRSFEPAARTGWQHAQSQATALLGSPAHSAQDVIAADPSKVVIPGKFAYGDLSVDMVNERVRVYLDDCQGWRSLGEVTTNADGRTALGANLGLPVGVYQVCQEMLGDGSVVDSLLWILPVGTRLAITDIDGTLTTSDGELVVDVIDDFFAPIGRGEYVPAAYPGAVDLTTAHVGFGHVVMYLTGRPYWLTRSTRTWLGELGFASGPLHTTDSNEQALPSDSAVGAFKRDFLLGLIDAGFVLDVGYGNATTDIFAYTGAGMAPEQVFIIGDNGGVQGTQKVDGSWETRAAQVRASPAVTQPWPASSG